MMSGRVRESLLESPRDSRLIPNNAHSTGYLSYRARLIHGAESPVLPTLDGARAIPEAARRRRPGSPEFGGSGAKQRWPRASPLACARGSGSAVRDLAPARALADAGPPRHEVRV